jgi:purine-binding chemotaxis protein CheW
MSATPNTPASTTSQLVGDHEFLAFALGGEEYGIDIQTVQEIRKVDPVTTMANAPAHLKGVINLRGIIVPIVDLRVWLGLDEARYDINTVVIVVSLHGHTVGLVVDGVSDVCTLSQDDVKPAPALHGTMNTAYIVGIGTEGERMLILVDIEALLSGDDMGMIRKMAA